MVYKKTIAGVRGPSRPPAGVGGAHGLLPEGHHVLIVFVFVAQFKSWCGSMKNASGTNKTEEESIVIQLLREMLTQKEQTKPAVGFESLNPKAKDFIRTLTEKLTLLVADDDHLFRQKFMDDILQPMQFKEIIQASNGKDAWQAFQEEKISVIFLDFDMPDICGTEVLQRCVDLNLANGLRPPAAIIISKYDDAAAIQEMLCDIKVQCISKDLVYRLINFTPQSTQKTWTKQEESFFWHAIMNALLLA